MRSREPDLPFDPKGLRPPPAWQEPQRETSGPWDLPIVKRGYDRDQVNAFLRDVTEQVEAKEGRTTGPYHWPVLFIAQQVRERRFATVRKGFDPARVDQLLGQLSARLEPLEAVALPDWQPPATPEQDEGWELGSLFS